MSKILLQRQQSGQALGGMPLVCQSVPHRHAAVLGQSLHKGLLKPAVLDTVEHAAQNPGCVLYALLLPQLELASRQVGGCGPLVLSSDGEGTPGPGGRLLEDQGNVLSLQAVAFNSLFPLLLQLLRQVHQIHDLLRCKVK